MDGGWGVDMEGALTSIPGSCKSIKAEIKHRMILCKKQRMGLPCTGVISGMREVCGHFFAENDVATMICGFGPKEQTDPTLNTSFLMFFAGCFSPGRGLAVELLTQKMANA